MFGTLAGSPSQVTATSTWEMTLVRCTSETSLVLQDALHGGTGTHQSPGEHLSNREVHVVLKQSLVWARFLVIFSTFAITEQGQVAKASLSSNTIFACQLPWLPMIRYSNGLEFLNACFLVP